MKRLITFICLIVIIFLGYTFITKGVDRGKIQIASYNTIEQKSEALTKKLAMYDKRNQEDYESAKTALDSSIKTYKNSKIKYETIVEELAEIMEKDPTSEQGEQIQEVIMSDQEKYYWDFVLIRLGNYGEKHGVDVKIDVATSQKTDPTSSLYEYFLADITFNVTGQYIDVANYIQDLENDEKLEWEINDFSMTTGSANGYTGVTAKFVVKGIPVDSESYIATVQNQTTEENNNNNTDGNTTSNTVSGNTVDNTVTNTTDTNTVSNSVSNNTVN